MSHRLVLGTVPRLQLPGRVRLSTLWPNFWLAVWLALATIGGGGCESSDDAIAKLATKVGDVSAQRKGADNWKPTKVGDGYRLGDAIQTGVKATATLTMRGGGKLEIEEKSVIRFTAAGGDKKAPKLDIVTGEAVLESEDDGGQFETSIGLAQLSSGGRVRLSSTPNGVRVDVLVGSALLEDEAGKSVNLERDKPLFVKVGGAIIEDENVENVATGVVDAGVEAGDASVAIEPESVAVAVTGRNVQMRQPGQKRWKRMRAGDNKVPFGTRIRVAKKGRAKVVRGDQVARVSGNAEFVVNDPDEPLITARRGIVAISTRETENQVKIPGGLVVAEPSPNGSLGTVAIKKNGQSTITAKRGSVAVKSKSGEEVLSAGETAKIGKRGKTVVSVRQPKRADFSVSAGESFAIHDPVGRTALRLRYTDACPELARVEIASSKKALQRSASGIESVGSALIWASRGRTYYRVRCIKDGVLDRKPAKSGSIRVTRDAGTKRLPRRAVDNLIDADGRKYDLAYQNLMPRLTFRWRQAPDSSSTLVIKPRSGAEKRIRVKGKQHTMPSGGLREGSYTWWFEAASGKRSPKTKLSLDFDSSAATAYVKKTPPGSWKGRSVPIEGAALQGWKVQIGGDKIKLDRHSRFNETVTVPDDENAIAIRLSHRRHGVHYYVRRRPKK